MTTEEKFNAAVNVIRSLPKNGSYQPSNELMLRFYAYFKQATQGPCFGSRPAFWDVVGRAKYDAWKKLGDMSKNDAMTKYVDELHSIVETMSYSDKVANFLEAPTNELDGINFDDLELVAGDVLEKVRSQPNSPLASREGSPIRFISNLSSSRSVSPSSKAEDSDHSDDEYIDTIELPNQLQSDIVEVKVVPNGNVASSEQATHLVPNGVPHVSRSRTRAHPHVDISQEIAKTIESLKGDVQRLTSQVNALEMSERKMSVRKKGFFTGLQPQIIVFIITWPFIASLIINRWLLRRK
ncbi:acyl-CoA-binding domain-containing protein 5 [Anthonomus grandis grandis]|uniref:acyl-CoA-binding domain-containing protein 5 n=1 Tax=Anthonomus grandis grandis TaxID=2921223 RepID=UPI0021651EDB|nr:acyl-CoA-binding domain-containing protein 5 [Anthonomus grandis grandis]